MGVGGDGEGRKGCASARTGGGDGKTGGFRGGDGDAGGERSGAGDNAGGGGGVLGGDTRFGCGVEINLFGVEGGGGRSHDRGGSDGRAGLFQCHDQLVHGSGELIDFLGQLGGPERLRRR